MSRGVRSERLRDEQGALVLLPAFGWDRRVVRWTERVGP